MKKSKKYLILTLVILVIGAFFAIPKLIMMKEGKTLTEEDIKEGKGLVSYVELPKERNLTIGEYMTIVKDKGEKSEEDLIKKMNADEVFAVRSLIGRNEFLYNIFNVPIFKNKEALQDVDLKSISLMINRSLGGSPIYHGDLSKIKTNDLYVRSVLMGENFFETRKEEIKDVKNKIERCLVLNEKTNGKDNLIDISVVRASISTIQVGDFLVKCKYKDAKASEPFYSYFTPKSGNDDLLVFSGSLGDSLVDSFFNETEIDEKTWKRFPYTPSEMNVIFKFLKGNFEIEGFERSDFIEKSKKIKLGEIIKAYNKRNVPNPVIRDSSIGYKEYRYGDVEFLRKMGI